MSVISMLSYWKLPFGVSFQRNPPFRVGEIIFDDEIPYGDEIRLDGGRVDFISSAKQISLKYLLIYDIIHRINKSEIQVRA